MASISTTTAGRRATTASARPWRRPTRTRRWAGWTRLSSTSTREDEQITRPGIYDDIRGMSESVLLAPFGEYMHRRLQALRLTAGRYRSMRAVKGRLPSGVRGP